MSTTNQKIFKGSYVQKLREELRSGASLAGYLNASFAPGAEDALESAIKIDPAAVELKSVKSANAKDRAKFDLENAIALYEAYPDLTEVQASDPRFWIYLTHCTFRKYVMERWPLDFTEDQLAGDDKAKTSAKNFISEHWLAGGNDRSLRRNALARLWWAVRLTVAPWESDPDYFGNLKNEDRYIYTKAIFATQDVFQQVLERSVGRDNRLLISVLEYIRTKGDAKRENVRDIMKELNLISSVRNVSALSQKELTALIEDIAQGSETEQ